MLKQSACVMFTCVGLSAVGLAVGCGGSSTEPATAADVAEEREFEASAEPEALTAPLDPNATQVTVDAALMERCGIKDAKIYFPYDSAEVKGNGDDRVRSMADCLVSGNLKGKELVVVGHTDPQGSAEYNKELGKSRAEAIADLLIAEGLPKEKVVIRSAGESAASEDKDEWPSDRRVALAVIAD
jgi:peptidoglycan-associated lipoprotein